MYYHRYPTFETEPMRSASNPCCTTRDDVAVCRRRWRRRRPSWSSAGESHGAAVGAAPMALDLPRRACARRQLADSVSRQGFARQKLIASSSWASCTNAPSAGRRSPSRSACAAALPDWLPTDAELRSRSFSDQVLARCQLPVMIISTRASYTASRQLRRLHDGRRPGPGGISTEYTPRRGGSRVSHELALLVTAGSVN